MYQPLHHKYRPQTFDSLVGQSAITTTLTNAINSFRIAPAYLFTGPRGTGKTSSARILALSLNCQTSNSPTAHPCGKCSSCRAIATGSALDVVEIDAASNSGVDNIRELIDSSKFAPIECRYKVYIIDEVHSLSSQAFQALLKTLEEPPANVVFILCTTEAHKVPATIISRCQRFDFRRIGTDTMVQHLKIIASKERIDITEEALQITAQLSSGCLRDAECLLDKLSLLSTTITPEWIWSVAGVVPETELLLLLKAIAASNNDAVQTILRDLLESGSEPSVILQSITSLYRDLLIAKTSPNKSSSVSLTESTWQQLCKLALGWETSTILQAQQHLRQCEAQVKLSSQPQLWLEISVLGLLPSSLPTSANNTTKTLATAPTKELQPWTSWTTPSDAIAWAQQQLPHFTIEALQFHWKSIKPVNGKKAVAWAEMIQRLAMQSSPIV